MILTYDGKDYQIADERWIELDARIRAHLYPGVQPPKVDEKLQAILRARKERISTAANGRKE